MSTITGYHAHVYFDAADRERADQLCKEAGQTFGVTVGRMHDKPVGPHPRGSCQLAFGPELFGQVIPWLIANRAGLTVFAHAEIGQRPEGSHRACAVAGPVGDAQAGGAVVDAFQERPADRRRCPSAAMTMPSRATSTTTICAPRASHVGLRPSAVSQPAPGAMS